MVSVAASGTLTTTGSEANIATPVTNGAYVLWLDLVLLDTADSVIVKAKRKVLSSGTIRQFADQTFSGVQDPPVQSMVPVSLPYGGDFTIQRLTGVDRNIPWSLETL